MTKRQTAKFYLFFQMLRDDPIHIVEMKLLVICWVSFFGIVNFSTINLLA